MTNTATATATPAKLRDGSWGVRIAGQASVGDVIKVVTKAGKVWTARVTRVLWVGQGVALCATESLDRPSHTGHAARASRTHRTGCSCGSVEEFEKATDCFTCRHDR